MLLLEIRRIKNDKGNFSYNYRFIGMGYGTIGGLAQYKDKSKQIIYQIKRGKRDCAECRKKGYQSYVQDRKKAGGSLTEEQKAEAKQMTIDECKALINDNLQKYIMKKLGNLDAWLCTQIEATIYTLKQKKERAI